MKRLNKISFIVIVIGKFILKLIYFFIKLLPIKKRITFISRQSDNPTLDIRLLNNAMEKEDVEIVILCKKIGDSNYEKIKYCFYMIKQMYMISRSKVVILDGYSIIVSILKHKKETKFVQMWHGLGALKKFGYSIINLEEGSSSGVADIMDMHHNYNYIFASGELAKISFMEAFNCNREVLKIFTLPRVDYLLSNEYTILSERKIYYDYPELKEKEVILYAPTFRKNRDITEKVIELINAVDEKDFVLIIKMHPLNNIKRIDKTNVIFDYKYDTIDMLSVSDYVITDYSAIAYEAAIKKLPLFFYSFDLEQYKKERGFYINYEKELPGKISDDANEIIKDIREKNYSLDRVEYFANKYIENKENCTEKIKCFLLRLLDTN